MTDPAVGSLSGRRALVTGAGRGIGAAIARMLSRRGADVMVVDIDLPEARQVAGSISAEGGHASAHETDITDEGALADLARAVEARPGGLDVLVNNAAILDVTPLSRMTRARFDRVQAVNQSAALWVTLAMLPALRASSRARVVNVASIQGVRGAADCVPYATAKGGVVNMTRALAVDLAPDGILVNCIAPGFVDTRMALLPDGSGHEHETDWFRDIYITHGRIPLRRAADPDDIAAAAGFFCGDDCRYVTGQILLVDGGVSATF